MGIEKWPFSNQGQPEHRSRPFPAWKLRLLPHLLSLPAAETAITIDDVVCVVNSGRLKEKSYDPYTNVSTLMVSSQRGCVRWHGFTARHFSGSK